MVSSDPTVLGSAVNFMTLNSLSPLLIIKDGKGRRSQHRDGKLRFAVCVDGSLKSIQALQFTSKLLDRSKGDQLMVLCVETSSVNASSVLSEV
jgi:hypothetical protein